MSGERVERRLAAILAADVAGFSALMERDEEGTYSRIGSLRRNVIEPILLQHNGRLIKTTGDGFLAEFASSIASLRCALAIQGAQLQDPDALRLRIGLNLGDVIVEQGGDVYGEGVNVAARLESLADPGGILISGKIHSEVEGKVTADFEDRGEQQVKNITRPVRIFAVRLAQVSTGSAGETTDFQNAKSLTLPDKPSIAVLPFQNMSADPEQEYFADGMVEEIITALSRFNSLFVIARNSSFTYKGRAVDIKQVGRELGVRYVLEGSVRKASGKVRITGQLIEAATNQHLWADRFDGSLEDVFDLQDRITESVVGSIAPRLEQAEIERTKRKPTDRLDSYDLFLRGMALLYQRSIPEAGASFQEAFARDPEYAAAYAMAAVTLIVPYNFAGMPVPPDQRDEAIRWARLAGRLGVEDALALARSAQVLSFNAGEYEIADGMIDRATTLNPNLAVVWFAGGFVSINCGDAERALDRFNRALRLSPLDPLRPNIWYGIAFALGALGKHIEGYAMAAKAVRTWPHVHSLGSLIFNSMSLNRVDEGREALQQLLKIQPNFELRHVIEVFHTRDLRLRHTLLDTFRQAGLN